MKNSITKLLCGLMLLPALGTQAQCTLSASVTATPATSPGLAYTLAGSSTGGTNVNWTYLNVLETGQSWQGTDSVNYTFPGTGNYTVCYYVSDSSNITNCYDSTCIMVAVNGGGATNCQVQFSSQANGNGAPYFWASPFLPPGWNVNYTWNMGDGTSETAAQFTHQYAASGTYSVTISAYAYDPNDSTQNCSSTYSSNVFVYIQCPLQAGVSAQPDSAGSLNYLLSGYASGGTPTTSLISVSTGANFNNIDSVQYTFPGPGTYYVCYYITDTTGGNGCQDSTCIAVTVGGSNPVNCSASMNTSNTSAGTFFFYGNVTTAPGAYTNYAWNFGDGSTAGGNNVYHTYTANGTYTVSLVTTSVDPNDSLHSCSTTTYDSVWVNYANGTNCTVSLGSVYSGNGNYTFTAYDSVSYSSYQSYYTWYIDGNSIGGTNYDTLNMSFNASGNHTVCVNAWHLNSASSSDSCWASACAQVSYYIPVSCNANFIMWPDSANNGVYYAYNNSTGNNLSYLWDFGDGTTSTQAYPQHNYAVQAQYNVCLTVSDSANNCTSTYCDSAGLFKTSGNGILGLTVLGTTLGIKNVEAELNINLFPNPVTENTSLAITSDKNARMQMNVINVMGQVVLSEQLNVSSGKNIIPVNTTDLSSGIYFLTVTNGNRTLKTIKLVK